MRIADYMQACLLHPEWGYYTTRDPLGAEGDFITAPEISQMFGELVGLSLAQGWIDLGRPDRIALAELGPGRGTLMADALRAAAAAVPGFADAVTLHLVEVSPRLRAAQAQRLSAYDPQWHADIAGLPDLPLLLVANEFFDALPIRQFLRDGDGWRERMVMARGEALAFGLGPVAKLDALAHRLGDTAQGDMVETCVQGTGIAAAIGGHIAAHGGAALIVDYGSTLPRGDTFQAVQAHCRVHPLAAPGEADLTAHVDFGALARAGGLHASAPTPQGLWLERLGITERARILARNLEGAALEAHVAAHRRLTHPAQMGHLFQAMSFGSGSQPLPGLDPGTVP
ncbi:class I SAM-dependent methyltransferase [Profundibacterium mesophilum]|nr:SAM-dependent methyltransferase [Profundibacterium mesophilum]